MTFIPILGKALNRSRKLRLEYPGGELPPLEPRGPPEDLFHGNPDRELFLRTLAEAYGKTDWQKLPAQLGEHPNGFPAKVKPAMKRRAETTRTCKWIAVRWHLGTGTNLANLLAKQRK